MVTCPDTIAALRLDMPKKQQTLDGLMEHHQIPTYARLQIPLRDPQDYRRLADILRGLANRVEFEATGDGGIDAVRRARHVWGDVSAANRSMATGPKQMRQKAQFSVEPDFQKGHNIYDK